MMYKIEEVPNPHIKPGRHLDKRHDLRVLNYIGDICECCPDVSDCDFGYEMQASDRCERVKRNLLYYGVIEG